MAVCKVPANDKEALASSLLSLMDKKRILALYKFINGVNFDDKSTWDNFDINTVPMKSIFEYHKISEDSIDFLGHAVALNFNDYYLEEPAAPTIKKMQLYLQSAGRYGDSPFLYPIYGLGGLPEAFSRLCAIRKESHHIFKQIGDTIAFS